MNVDEAKLILEVARPGDAAAADPQLAEALALARRDAELGAWLDREQRWDAAVRRELATVPVPAALRAQLLAGPKVVPLPVVKSHLSFFTWPTPLYWGLAAAVVLFLSLAVNWSRSRAVGKLADFARDMIAAAPVDAHHVDVVNTDFAQVKGWLADHRGPADINLPPVMQNSPGLMGCRIMNWHGQTVSMLCYVRPGSHHVDLFVTRAANLADAPEPGKPMYVSFSQNATACWRDGDNVYVLAGAVPMEFLHQCLERPVATRARLPGFFAMVY